MTFTPHGRHLIAGEWIGASDTFASDPAHGPAHRFSVGTTDLIDRACQAAGAAFAAYAATSRSTRAAFLDRIADEIDARAEAITAIGTAETGLPAGRLQGERGRTTGQLRLFARHIREGAHLDRRHDVALPDRQPAPRQELLLIQRPIGPVAVFGASNFPLAFSTAGGDTAAALAAGCPVVVKGHSAHPGTSEIVAEAIQAARIGCGLPPGMFSLVQGGRRDVGVALVQHPAIKAVGFTGSQGAGRMLYDLCAARPEPIPFFGELGAVNPLFLLPAAMQTRAAQTARDWVASLTLGAGQFCTKPGIVILPTEAAEPFASAAVEAAQAMAPQCMLTSAMARSYAEGASYIAVRPGVQMLLAPTAPDRQAAPHLYQTTAAAFLADPALAHEVFGPFGLIVTADAAERLAIAEGLAGQLTATLHLETADHPEAARLLATLEHKAGRVLVNGFPTGVEVADAMVHGGPWPASTNFGATSVGTMAIRRFLRPVCYQNLPETLWPQDLRA